MRCQQARKRINEAFLSSIDISGEKELLEHLEGCSTCAQLVQASRLVNRDFKAASVDDRIDNVPFMFLKARVEAQANLHKQKDCGFMTKLTDKIKEKSKLSISLTAVVAALIIFSLVPFSINQNMGYEVAFAGVDKDLALNTDKLEEILIKLGIDVDATNIEVSGCETTCDVKFSSLKSPKDAQLIKAVFADSDKMIVAEDIRVIISKVKAPAFQHFKNQLSLASEDDHLSNEEAHRIIIEKLGEDFDLDECVWVFKSDSECFDPAGAEDRYIIQHLDSSVFIGESCGDFNGLTLQNLDEEAIQKLKDQGFSVDIQNEEDQGMVRKRIIITNSIGTANCNPGQGTDTGNADEDDASEKSQSELPEGFALSQNYPNPFNPNTTIDFTIPVSNHVSLMVYNVNGQKVKTLVDSYMSSGTHSVEWDATDENGNKVASGIYLYRFQSGDVNYVKKATLIK